MDDLPHPNAPTTVWTAVNRTSFPTIALLHWGDLIEDFLDSIGVSFAAFCTEMTGGWMFGYIEALRLAGVRTVLICISGRVKEAQRHTHQPTGATIWVLPVSRRYGAVRRHLRDPYGWTLQEAIGEVRGMRRPLLALLKDLAPYLATPLRALAQTLRQEGCQAILCQEYEYARFDLCVLLGQWLGLPTFATFQGGNFQLSRLERPLRPVSLRACTGLIVATQTEIDRLHTHYRFPKQKLAQIFNPMDVTTWQALERHEARRTLNIPVTAQVVIYHGRIDLHRKGLDVLLEAWQLVCDDRPELDLRLFLVGTGSDAEILQQRLQARPIPGIQWVNEYILDRGLIQQYLSAADIYTLPSRHEGFPVALIEAMACGLPVVATDAPGVPDILAQGAASGGLMVPREDAIALAAALGQVLDQPVWRTELGQLARRRVEACCSLEAVGQQLRAFLVP